MSKKWTKEKELDLLVNFYELSIEEARERYDASYKTIAGRLEKLFDDDSEEGIELLLEASKKVKLMKRIDNFRNEDFTRKQRRLRNKINKLQRKLDKLRGDENGKNER
tara:strand:- start:84 stop:407 length:324 start_codon:yes stop_codon:yes gene_type:complete